MADREIYETSTLGTVTDNDNIYFTGGNTPVTINLDQSGLATGLGMVRVTKTWNADIGAVTTPFRADIDAGSTPILDYQAGSGFMYFYAGGASTTATKVRVGGNGTLVGITGGSWTQLEVFGGNCTYAEGVTAVTAFVAGGSLKINGTAGTKPTTFVQTGGRVHNERAGTTMTISGGEHILDAATNTITTMTQTGGVVKLRRTGTITTYNWYGGEIDVSEISKPITFTTINIWHTAVNAEELLQNVLITRSTTNHVFGGN